MEKYMKYDSTMEIKIHVFRFGKGDENKNSIDRLQVKVNFTRQEKKGNCCCLYLVTHYFGY